MTPQTTPAPTTLLPLLIATFLPAPALASQVEDLAIVARGPETLHRPPPVLAARGDGTVALPLPHRFEVQVISADGNLLYSVGEPGEEPGQFKVISMIGWRGDTLWVADQALYRVTFFPPPNLTPRVEEGRSQMLERARMRVPLPTASGEWISMRRTQGPDGEEWEQWVRVTPDWSRAEPVSLLGPRIPRVEFATGDSSRVVAGLQPFPTTRIYSLAPSGESTAVVRYDPDGHEYHLTRIGRTGDSVFSMTKATAPLRVDSITRARVVEEFLESGSVQRSPLGIVELRSRVEAAIDFPDHHPAASRVVVAIDDRVWVRREDRRYGGVVWDVFDAAGEAVGSFRLPHGMERYSPAGLGGWGVLRDGSGYALVRVARDE